MTDIMQEKNMNDIDIQQEIKLDIREMFPGEPDRHMGGFRTPVILSDNLIGFIREANLGKSDPFSENEDSLSSQLLDGISTRAILTQLFHCYVILNDMRDGPR